MISLSPHIEESSARFLYIITFQQIHKFSKSAKVQEGPISSPLPLSKNECEMQGCGVPGKWFFCLAWRGIRWFALQRYITIKRWDAKTSWKIKHRVCGKGKLRWRVVYSRSSGYNFHSLPPLSLSETSVSQFADQPTWVGECCFRWEKTISSR